VSVLRGPHPTWRLDAPEGTALTLGVFDGVHIGHQHLLRVLADNGGGRPRVVMTFDPHPVEIIAPELAPKLLTGLDHRIELLLEYGADHVAVLPFTEELRMMSADRFTEEVVAGALRAKYVAVGDQFHYGYRMKGDVGVLRDLGAALGFDVDGIPIVGGDRPIRSTGIRQAVGAGRMREAADLLGRPFQVRDVVRVGDRRGRQLGFPTANLDPDERMVRPGRGVYAARAHLDGLVHDAVVNVGIRPTVDGTVERVEVHILDWDGDLYGRLLPVDIIDRIRAERRFDSLDDLVAQIGVDVEVARDILAG
jgi:riboflavin kinase/FMN adenylyltransferase